METRPGRVARATGTLAAGAAGILLLITPVLALEDPRTGGTSPVEQRGGGGAVSVEPEAGSESPANKRNLVLALRSPEAAPEVAVLRYVVRAADLKEALRGQVRRSQAGLSGGVFIPPGRAREIHITALDSKDQVLYEGKTLANIGADKPATVGAILESREHGEPIAVTLSRHAIRIERLPGRDGQVRLRAQVRDPDGAPVRLTPDDYRWGLDWLHPYELIPGGKKPKLEVDTPATGGTEVAILNCLENTLVTFCATDNCAVIDPCADPVVAISAGGTHTCALTRNGVVLCWGNNSDGQLGSPQRAGCDGLYSNEPFCTPTPTRAACGPGEPCNFKQISAGRAHTCAIDTSDAVWCWGDNRSNQLGAATPDSISVVPVRSVANALAIAAGDDFTCAITRAGVNNAQRQVMCWGANDKGQTGQPLTAPSSERFPGPQIVIGPVDPIATPTVSMSAPPNKLIVAGSRHACAVTTDGWMSCWGDDNQRQVANTGAITVAPITGTPFPGSETCGTCTIQRVRVAGFLLAGGSGSPLDRATAGGETTCASFTGAWTDCWGENRFTFPSSFEVRSIEAGSRHTCAVTDQGTFCWGEGGVGQLGDGGLADRVIPSLVLTSLTFEQVTAGGGHTCGLTAAGKVACWGSNREGQLGTGSTGNSVLTPVNSRF
jgi:alpha-tubulin suppressor-like RCC1 family protein